MAYSSFNPVLVSVCSSLKGCLVTKALAMIANPATQVYIIHKFRKLEEKASATALTWSGSEMFWMISVLAAAAPPVN